MRNRIKAFTKYLLSFLRGYERLEDYPVRFTYQGEEGPTLPQVGEAAPWRVQIINWWQMAGLGNTRQEAYEDLREHFDDYKADHGELPRPGTRVPILMAETGQVDRHALLARDFFRRILEMDYENVFISDQSSLYDFFMEPVEVYQERIEAEYGVDVSDIEDGNLVRIFERLRRRDGTG
jgi:hypothetical protein